MLYFSALFVSGLIFAFLIRYFSNVFINLAENSVSLLNELLSESEDEDKLQEIQSSTNKLLLSLIKMFLVTALAFTASSLPILIISYFLETGLTNIEFSSAWAILSLSVGATIPFIIPSVKVSPGSYSELSKLLHRIALDNFNIANKLFSQEKKKIQKQGLERREDFVIVSGLARAGTTSLMNDLSKNEDFKSLSYANMPFLMCPNIWARFYRPRGEKLSERSHKDGIMISLNSNEALEEYFFKVRAMDAYIQEDHLSEYEISKEDYEAYLDYQSIIKLDNNKIYLAKNNNFLLRYHSVREYNSEFLMVILFREPLSHAASLLEKHAAYQKLQDEDPFVLEYMNWLGHHEFGQHQKPFAFDRLPATSEGDKSSLDYWLSQWLRYYNYVLTISHPNTILVNYDSYCADPNLTISKILTKRGLQVKATDLKPFSNKRKGNHTYSSEVYEASLETYNQLIQRQQ